jgi:hypothetical protein
VPRSGHRRDGTATAQSGGFRTFARTRSGDKVAPKAIILASCFMTLTKSAQPAKSGFIALAFRNSKIHRNQIGRAARL